MRGLPSAVLLSEQEYWTISAIRQSFGSDFSGDFEEGPILGSRTS